MPRYYYSRRNSFKPRSLKRFENKARNKLLVTTAIGAILVLIFLIWGLPILIGNLEFLNKFKDKPGVTDNVSANPAISAPVLNIPYEATNTATIRIDGYSTPNSKVEIYLDGDLKTTAATSADGSFLSEDITLALGNNNITGKTVDDQGKKSLASKNIRLTYSNQKPKLDISSPADNQQIKGGDKKVVVSGKTDPADSITVNGTTVIVGNDGNFSLSLDINEGDNNITIAATDQYGNTNQAQRKVNYTP